MSAHTPTGSTALGNAHVGAFASVLAAFAALLVAEYAFKWTGDAGLPKSVLLFLSVGALAGVA